MSDRAQVQPPVVVLEKVVKRYGAGPVILDEVSFTAQRGDFISLIGPSGCGKSTILKLISALSPVSGGRLVVEGIDPREARQEMFFVFQEPTLLPWLTAVENVATPLRLRGIPLVRRTELATRSLALVGLGDRTTYYPRQLSGGQKMRVSIARALSMEPRIILLDEPFGALDEMTRDHLDEELLSIREKQSWTAFFVTHSVAEAVFLSNRILVFSANPGRLYREIKIELPYPRTEETRQSLEYQKLVAEVSKLLRSVENLPRASAAVA